MLKTTLRKDQAGDPDGSLLLFNDPRYIGLNLDEGQSVFRYDHFLKDHLWFGSLVGTRTCDVIDCGWKAPYGGPDIARAGASTKEILDFLGAAAQYAKESKAKALRIRTRPSYHSSNEASVQFALLNLGFSVETCELCQGVDVTRFTSIEHYIARLKASQRNQIRRGLSQFEPQKCSSEAEWVRAYEVLAHNRSFRGERLKFTIHYLLKLQSLFPNRLSMFALLLSGQPVAAALVYHVTSYVDHIVAWGDDRSAREIAPVGCIAVNVLDKAMENGVHVLDIGVSSVNGVPDDGLISFKRHTLATSGLRLNLVKDF